jgi:hypothetical protein
MAHPSGDAGDANWDCHVVPPRFAAAILLASGGGSNSGCGMAFLFTWHGTLRCRHRQSGALVHRPLLPASDDIEPVVLDLPIEQLQLSFGHHLRELLP